MSPSKIEALVPRLIQLIAIMGIFYQVFFQTIDYLAYPSYTSIALAPVTTRLPAISLCASYWDTPEEDGLHEQPISNSTILMPSYGEVIDFCYLTLPNGSQVNCTLITKPHKYMSHCLLCFSFFEKARTFLPDDQLMYSPETKMDHEITSPLLTAGLKNPWQGAEHSAITIRSYDTPIQLLRSSESKAWLEPKVDARVTIKYRITRRVELPPPHGECRNYPAPFDADSSMVECFTDTYHDEEDDTKLVWPWWVFFDYERNYTDEQLSRNIPLDEAMFGEIARACMQANSRVDCDNSYILVQRMTIQRTNETSRPMIIEIPWLPTSQLNITNHIKTPLAEYFNQVGSILSMWVGFAIFPTYLQFIAVASRIIRAVTRSNASSSLVSSPSRPGRLRRLNDLTLGLLSWISTVYFVIEIALIYVERPFIICIIARVPMSVKILGLSLCLDMVINPDRVESLYPDVYRTVPPEKWRDVLSINQLFETTTEFYDLLNTKGSDYLTPSGEFEQISKHFNLTKSITGHQTCFTTLRQQDYLLPEPLRELERASASFGENAVISLKTAQLRNHNISRINVFFGNDGLARDYHTAANSVTIFAYPEDRLNANEFFLRTYRTSIELFADHIKSSCWHYEEKFGFKRDIVFNKCVVKKFTSKYNLWPSGYQVWRSWLPGRDMLTDSVKMGHFHLSNESMRAELDRIYAQCQHIVRKVECHQLFVKIGMEAESFADLRYTDIVLQPSSKQFIAYEQQLIYTLIDLAGYIGGTIGTWVGLSFLAFEEPIKVLIRRLRGERPQSQVSNPRLLQVDRRARAVHGWRHQIVEQ